MPAEAARVRWRLDLGYDGAAFAGWATQIGQRTVQGDLELWLARVLHLDEPPRLVCAGRTDAGVHARGQVAHVDLAPGLMPDPAVLTQKLNRVLPADLVLWRVSAAPEGFHARFSAIWRRYAYRLSEPDAHAHPLYRNQLTALRQPVDLDLLNRAADTLLGLRDFGAYCRRREGGTTIRTLLELRAERVTDGPLYGVIECTVRADAFCHSMVRSLVGALVEVGTGRRDVAWLEKMTSGAVRDPAIPVLAARGLTLEEVRYPADAYLAERAREARTVRTTVPT